MPNQSIKHLMCFLLMFLWGGVFFTHAQQVTGTVVESTSGDPLPGVNIVVQGTNQGTQSDFDGNFSIAASEGDILVFSYIGSLTQEVVV